MTHDVSIYIPTRNRRPLLARAIASVRQQTHENIQIIVVDDGSTDDTPEYLRDLSAQEPRLIVLHTETPRGASRCFFRAGHRWGPGPK
jgi:glycosyltransferase involved in cell wall biosynthesis